MLKKRRLAVLLVCALCLLGGTGCRNVRREKELLTQAQGLIEERKYPQAIGLLSEIADNETAAELLDQLYYVISGDYIVTLDAGVAAIDREGRVRVAAHPNCFWRYHGGMEETLKIIEEWEDIRRLSGAWGVLEALDKDGSFYTIDGADMYEDYTDINRRIAELEPLRLLFPHGHDFTAVQMDGTFCAYDGYSDYLEQDSVKQQMAQWTDIKYIISGAGAVVVLLGDGTVDFVTGYSNCERQYSDMREWTDIVAIDGMGGCIAGLKSDGTVVVSNHGVGEAERACYKQAMKWTDIIAVSMGGDSLLGLKRDGTVVVAGRFNSGHKEVKEWTDIVAISAAEDVFAGLKSDGTVVIAGSFESELEEFLPEQELENRPELPDVTGMKDLYVPEITVDSSKLQ